MSGTVFYCNWWKCLGTKLFTHTNLDCPHMRYHAITRWSS